MTLTRKPKTKRDLIRNLLFRSLVSLPLRERLAIVWNAYNTGQSVLKYYELNHYIPNKLKCSLKQNNV
jgi:hypothetical protein